MENGAASAARGNADRPRPACHTGLSICPEGQLSMAYDVYAKRSTDAIAARFGANRRGGRESGGWNWRVDGRRKRMKSGIVRVITLTTRRMDNCQLGCTRCVRVHARLRATRRSSMRRFSFFYFFLFCFLFSFFFYFRF